MFKLSQVLFPAFIILFLSCKNETGNTYAIKDFRKPLQPLLVKIVSEGIVRYYDSSKIKMITDKELIQLSKSDNPVLRATAFREILKRKSFNHFDILMNNLNDTASVSTDGGEFGIWRRTVSDDILEEATWETNEAKNETIEKVLTQHNYLRSAYLILLEMEPQEKYYSIIKDMATRPRYISEEGYEMGFDDIEYAMYGLAKFKKPGDIAIIRDQMNKRVWELSNISLRLIKDFPDTTFFDVLQAYYRRQFYKFSGNRRGGFSGVIADRADPEDFISALVMQQSDKSAQLLEAMLKQLPLEVCMPDRDGIIEKIVLEIWDHPCLAYSKLREKIEPRAKEILKGQISVTLDSLDFPVFTSQRKIRWLDN